jgi:hypothetical protein
MSHRYCQDNMLILISNLVSMSQAAKPASFFPP